MRLCVTVSVSAFLYIDVGVMIQAATLQVFDVCSSHSFVRQVLYGGHVAAIVGWGAVQHQERSCPRCAELVMPALRHAQQHSVARVEAALQPNTWISIGQALQQLILHRLALLQKDLVLPPPLLDVLASQLLHQRFARVICVDNALHPRLVLVDVSTSLRCGPVYQVIWGAPMPSNHT